MIRRNYAKSFDGFKNRILSKIMALTIIQLINKLNNRNINNLKTVVAKMYHGWLLYFYRENTKNEVINQY